MTITLKLFNKLVQSVLNIGVSITSLINAVDIVYFIDKNILFGSLFNGSNRNDLSIENANIMSLIDELLNWLECGINYLFISSLLDLLFINSLSMSQ